jgi:hypothetical protein
MSVLIITYDAKCKHCLFMEYRKLPKVNGTMSKRSYAFCENKNSERHGHPLTLKSKACDKIEL